MGYRKSTLRKMQPFSRKLAKLINELESVERRLKNLLDEAQQIELDARAIRAQREAMRTEGQRQAAYLQRREEVTHE